MATEPEVLIPDRFEHPEGLAWSPRNGRLLWIDFFAGNVLSYDLGSGELDLTSVGRSVGAVAPRAPGGLVCSVREGFGLLSAAGEFKLTHDLLDQDSHLMLTDGAVDAEGRFWAGSMTFEFETKPGTGSLYRLDPNGHLSEQLDGISVSNGIGWSPGSDRMYYVDSATHRIDQFEFDLERGELGIRRPLAEFEAMPDGLAVDADGCIWVALFGASRVARITPDGKIDRQIELPATQVTTCAFGGPDLATLFIAVSPYGLDPASPDAQRSGHIFAFDPGVRGLPVSEFAG